MSKQEDRLDFFTKLIKKNRIFEQDEMKVIPLVESTLMYFSGIFCENSKRKRCRESQNSICRVTNSNAGHWKRNSKAISYFVFRGDDGYWQLTDVVKDRLDELGIKYKTYSFEQHKEDIPYVPDTVETKSTETKKTSTKFLDYNHASLIEWYKDFISLNSFNKANDRDFQVIEAISVNIPLNEFVSSFNEAEKNNPRPCYSSLIKKHAKNFQTATKKEDVEEQGKEPINKDDKVIPLETRLKTANWIDNEANSFEKIYNDFYKNLDEKRKSKVPSYEKFYENNSKYDFYSRTQIEIRKSLVGFLRTEGKEIKQVELKDVFVQSILLYSTKLAENQRLKEINFKKKNPEPPNQNEDLTAGKGLDDDWINEFIDGGK